MEGVGGGSKSVTKVIRWAFGVEVSRVLIHVGCYRLCFYEFERKKKKLRLAGRECFMIVWDMRKTSQDNLRWGWGNMK